MLRGPSRPQGLNDGAVVQPVQFAADGDAARQRGDFHARSRQTFGQVAVSYTHLDVYKRQGQVLALVVDLQVLEAAGRDHDLALQRADELIVFPDGGFQRPACLLYTSRCV